MMNLAATIEGVLEHIVFFNEENGYTVARLQEAGKTELTSIVGILHGVKTGENLQLHGTWSHHPKYGRQFQLESYRVVPPSTLLGLQRYLSSGIIRGIGKKTAERLVKHFGLETLEVIEKQPERLAEIKRLGKKKIQQIVASWAEQRAHQEIMVFLQSYGVTLGQGRRILGQYGAKTVDVIRSNPYRLSKDVEGIGFRTADRIAQNLGIPRDSMARAEAGLLYVLGELTEEGHVCYPRGRLLDEAQQILGVDLPVLENALERQVAEDQIVIEGGADPRVYLKRYHVCEVGISERLAKLIQNPGRLPRIDSERAISWAETRSGLRLAEGQKRAIRMVLTHKVSVITGGPGVGKTTIVNAILQVLSAKNLNVALAAPTGRAAKRLSESSGKPAKTLHRLLRFNPALHHFEANEDHPLEDDVFIVDECSMIDVVLMYHFLKALRPKAHLILVGDSDQLPSVGPGNVLRDIIDSGRVGVTHLDVVFRQAARSTILEWAHAINRGDVPLPPPKTEELSDLYFVEKEEPEEILRLILNLCTERIPKRFGFHPARDIQVLTPMHKGVLGVTNLNIELQKMFNPEASRPGASNLGIHEGDKVMQIRNNYEREVFNGDIGFVSFIDSSDAKVTVRFDDRDVEIPFTGLNEIVPAYAISVHKSQGSEYPAVVLPLVTQHFVLLQRNLLYTAITRARSLVVLVGSRRALRIAVLAETVRSRFTSLRERITRLIS